MTEEKELQPVDIEWEAEKICRWGAARAGVIVVAPLVGTMALLDLKPFLGWILPLLLCEQHCVSLRP